MYDYKYFRCEIAHTPQCPQQGNPLMTRILLRQGSAYAKEDALTIDDIEEADALCQNCKSFIPTP